MVKNVAIVGAGISGLLACKYTLSKGFCPIVFESRSSIGGVWINTLETTKLQTPKSFFQFTDCPWPSSVVEDFPNQQQVYDYVHSYATHFDLLKYIRFSSKVESINYVLRVPSYHGLYTIWFYHHLPAIHSTSDELVTTEFYIIVEVMFLSCSRWIFWKSDSLSSYLSFSLSAVVFRL